MKRGREHRHFFQLAVQLISCFVVEDWELQTSNCACTCFCHLLFDFNESHIKNI